MLSDPRNSTLIVNKVRKSITIWTKLINIFDHEIRNVIDDLCHEINLYSDQSQRSFNFKFNDSPSFYSATYLK